MNALIARKSKTTLKQVTEAWCSFTEYATVHHYFHCKRGSQNTEHFALHKNIMVEDLGAQKMQNPSQVKNPI